MDVIGTWTGSQANALQTAMRMTSEAFAHHLGVALRTVAKWHANPDAVPGQEIQQILDTAYERAGAAVHRRFALLARPAQALRVGVAIVVRGGDVLLVCRRGDAAISWQFPAGVIKPGASAEAVTVEETLAETGVRCVVRQRLGSRLHPVTGVICDYYLCAYLAGEAVNHDVIENTDVTWAPCAELTRYIPADRIYPPILAALEVPA